MKNVFFVAFYLTSSYRYYFFRNSNTDAALPLPSDAFSLYCKFQTCSYSMRFMMSQNDTMEIIQSLLASKELSDDTREDLGDFEKDIERGNLHKDDEAYVQALANRLNVSTDSKKVSKNKRSNSATRTNAGSIDWQERAVIAEARVEELENDVTNLKKKIKDNNNNPQKSSKNSWDKKELQDLIDQLYDAENDQLQKISNEDASAILKKMKVDLS